MVRRYVAFAATAMVTIACGLSVTGTGEAPGGVDGGGTAPASGDAAGGTTGADGSSGGSDGGGSSSGGSSSGGSSSGAPDSGAFDAPNETGSANPASCTELGAAALGTDVTLYVNHDPTAPWSAHCQLTNGVVATYLLLNDTKGNNFSSYPVGGCASLVNGMNDAVKTTWTMVRIDPGSLVVDTSDYTGSTSIGGTHEESGNGSFKYDYLRVPFAAGRTCDDNGPTTQVGKVDLSKTKFAVASGQQWSVEGFSNNNSNNTGKPGGGASLDPMRRMVTLAAQGFPAGINPCPPLADYYTKVGGACLALSYVR